MWTETGQILVALGPGVPIGVRAGQTEDLVSDRFAAVFGEPVTGSSAEEALVTKGDAPAGFGLTWTAVPPGREAGPSVDGALPSDLASASAGPDTTLFVSRGSGAPDWTATMAQTDHSGFRHPSVQGPQAGFDVSATVLDDGKAEHPASPRRTNQDRGTLPLLMSTMAEVTTVVPFERTRVADGRAEIPASGPERQSAARLPELPPEAGAMAQPCRPGPSSSSAGVTRVTGESAVELTGEPVEAAVDHLLSRHRAGLPLAEGMVDPARVAVLPPDAAVDVDKGKLPWSGGSGAAAFGPGRLVDHPKIGGDGTRVQAEPSEPKATDASRARWLPAIGVAEGAASSEPEIAPGAGPVTLEISGTDRGIQTEEAILAGRKPIPSPGPASGPDQGRPMAMDGSISRPVLGPVGTEAERFWLGRMHWNDDFAVETRRALANDAVAIPSNGASEVVQRGRADPVLARAEVVGATLTGPEAWPLEALDSLVTGDTEIAAFVWSPSGQPAPTVSPVAGPMPAGPVPQLAAVIAASLHHRVDGTTEIALSPDELGAVRLRLEADTGDPDRMIVHLVFDRPETMDLFRRHAEQLSEAIRAAGYAEVKLDFGQHGASADTGGGQDAPDRSTDGGAAAGISDHGPGEQAKDTRFPQRLASAAGLDLRL